MANNITNKIGDGVWTLYLYECPKCHCTRKLDKEKLAAVGGLTAVGIGGSMLLGAPVAGWFAAIGLTKLAIAGTISSAMAAQLIRANYQLLIKMSERKMFSCPHCGCFDLVDMKAVSTSALQTRDSLGDAIGRKSAEVCDLVGNAMERGSVFVGKQCENLAQRAPVLFEAAKLKGREIVQDIDCGLNNFDRQIDKGIRNLKKWWRGL